MMWLKRVELTESVCLKMDRLIDEKHREFAAYDLEDSDGHEASTSKKPKSPKESAGSSRKQQQQTTNCRLVHLVARRLLLTVCKFCHLNVDDANQRISYKCASKNRNEPRKQQQQQLKSRPQIINASLIDWWPDLISLVHYLCMLVVSYSLYYHYVYDYNRLHLERLRQARLTCQHHIVAQYEHWNLTELHYELEMGRARQWLDSLGAPFLEASYAPECCYLYLLITALAVHVLFRLYVRFGTTIFDFHILRLLLNRNNERKNFNRLICEQCNRFLQSSCNFTEASVNRCLQLNGRSSFRLESQSRLCRLLLGHKCTIRALVRMALAGQLQPLNKTDDYLDRFEFYYCLAMVQLASVGFSFSFMATLLLPRLNAASTFEIRLELASDLLASLELVVMWSVVCMEALFYVSFTLANCIDQILLIKRLLQLVGECIGQNERLFHENFDVVHDWRRLLSTRPKADDPGQVDDDNSSCSKPIVQEKDSEMTATTATKRRQLELVARMNERLLACLMHYKLFVAKLKTVQRSFAPLCLCMVLNAFTLPLVARLHVPYMGANVKLYIIAISLNVFLLSNVCLTACCLLSVHSLKLYERLWTLLAHTIDLTTGGNSNLVRIYDEHTVWMLRKELNHSGPLTDQFATRALGISFNFANLFRIYFWFGLVIVSILVDASSSSSAQSAQESAFMGSLAYDPLGLYEL